MDTTRELLPVASGATECCEPDTAAGMSSEEAEATARVLKALADPARLRLLSLIAACEGCEACVCDLTEPVGLSQPTVSHHLKVLAEAGLVARDKRGVWAYYSIVPGALEALSERLVRQLAPSAVSSADTPSGSKV